MEAIPPLLHLDDILFTQRAKPRGDELEAHVSDLYGCDRATWYRRRGEKPLPFTHEKLALFAIGRGYEAIIANDLKAAGFAIDRDVRVTVFGLIGHVDIVVDDAHVIEVKTTGLRLPKPFVSTHYAVQVAGYAIGRGQPGGIVWVYHKGSDIETQYVVVLDALAHDASGASFDLASQWHGASWRSIIEERAREVHELTADTQRIPPADPGELSPWGCKYCDWAQCERNPKHDPDGGIPR